MPTASSGSSLSFSHKKKHKIIYFQNLLFPLQLYCRGSIDMTVEWIFAPKERTPEQMAALLVSALPMPVTELFQQLGVLR